MLDPQHVTDLTDFSAFQAEVVGRLPKVSSVYRITLCESAFTSDRLGRMRTRIDYTWAGARSPGRTVQYVFAGWRVMEERANRTPTVTYTRGNELSCRLQGTGGVGGLLARSHGYSGGNWATNNCYFADGNGNVVRLVDSSQAVVASYRYDPYGRAISTSGSLAAANVYRFSSKELHVRSGMYYYGYRFYEPNSQRWMTRDPVIELGFLALTEFSDLGERLAGNLYSFVRNEPVDLFDPYGLQDGQCDTDKCKERCHKWAEALSQQGGFNARQALLTCLEGCDRDPNYIPGSPLPPLHVTRPNPKEPIWPLVKSCAKLVWEWCKDKGKKKK